MDSSARISGRLRPTYASPIYDVVIDPAPRPRLSDTPIDPYIACLPPLLLSDPEHVDSEANAELRAVNHSRTNFSDVVRENVRVPDRIRESMTVPDAVFVCFAALRGDPISISPSGQVI